MNPRRAERRYQLEVRRNLTRNFLTHLFHGMFGQTGFRLLNAPTFLPAYILMLSGGSDVLVALALAAQSLGGAVTPLIGANVVEHRAKVLPAALTIGLLVRLCILIIALAGWLLPPHIALVVIIAALVLWGMGQGMQGVAFHFLLAKVIPVSRRGRLTGWRNFSAGITSAGVSYLGGLYLLGADPTVDGYSSLFALSFGLTAVSLFILMWMKEPLPPVVKPKVPLTNVLGRVPEMLRADKAYRRFVMARALGTAGRLALPFYILYAANDLALSGTNLAVLTIAFTLAGTVSNLVWGAMADRHGFRRVYLTAIALWVISTIALLVSGSSLLATALVFAGIGAAVQGFMSSSTSLVWEFGEREDLPLRIAIANSTSEAVGTVATIAAGFIAAAFGYPTVFAISIALLASGGLLVRRFVPDPRFRG